MTQRFIGFSPDSCWDVSSSCIKLKVKGELRVKERGIPRATDSGQGTFYVVPHKKVSQAGLERSVVFEGVRCDQIDFRANKAVVIRIYSVARAISRCEAAASRPFVGVERIARVSEPDQAIIRGNSERFERLD